MIIAAMPNYNEEKTIAKIVVRAVKYVDKVLVVDERSEDGSRLIAEKLGAIVVKHEKNMGSGDCTHYHWVYLRRLGFSDLHNRSRSFTNITLIAIAAVIIGGPTIFVAIILSTFITLTREEIEHSRI